MYVLHNVLENKTPSFQFKKFNILLIIFKHIQTKWVKKLLRSQFIFFSVYINHLNTLQQEMVNIGCQSNSLHWPAAINKLQNVLLKYFCWCQNKTVLYNDYISINYLFRFLSSYSYLFFQREKKTDFRTGCILT